MQNTPLQDKIQYHCDKVMDVLSGKSDNYMAPHLDFLNTNGYSLVRTDEGFLTITKTPIK